MASYVVASVPYLNAKPLVRFFEEYPSEAPVRVRYDVPSKLPALLDAGEADAVLASSIDALMTSGRTVADGLCIASEGPVKSVRLFSKVPPHEIRSVAFDRSSLTSNALAKIVLAERYGVRPEGEGEPPHLRTMLENHDACVLIGDIGLRTSGEGLHVLDLGAEWTDLTGLPFVWAMWIGTERLTPELSLYLNRARAHSCLGRRDGRAPKGEFDRQFQKRQNEMIAAISEEEGWPEEEVRDYLLKTIAFDLGEREKQALGFFQQKLTANGILEEAHEPRFVAPALPALSV